MRILVLIFSLTFAITAHARETRGGLEVADLGSISIDVYTYRPKHCGKTGLLFVFAGYNRDADRYRDRAIPLADRSCLMVYAPELDRKRFPNWRYHRAGVSRKGRVMPQEQWTGRLLMQLIAWARNRENRPDAPYILFGHSAGGQLLSRFAAYMPPSDASRIVIANPSVHVRPSLSEKVPYGFAGIFDKQQRSTRLQAYLKLPITIYLGTADTGSRLLVKNEAAKRQGQTRYERGVNVFRAARNVARANNWDFNWTLVEVPGVGHSSRAMLRAPQAEQALGLR